MKYKEIVASVNKILEGYSIRLTLRQIFYRLVSNNECPNTKTAYKTLSHLLVMAREKGEVDDNSIEDRNRSIEGYGDHGQECSLREYLEREAESFMNSWKYWNRKLWTTQETRVLICLEKDALSTLFTSVANRYRVLVCPTKGYGSYTFLKEIAEKILEISNQGEIFTIVKYFGDYDPSGRDIERDLRARLERYGATNFEVKRIALTPEQIEELKLPMRPEDAETLAKLARDVRSAKYGTKYACELDAIEPNKLQEFIEECITEEIDFDAWNQKIQQIKEEQNKLRKAIETVKIDLGEEGSIDLGDNGDSKSDGDDKEEP